MYGQITPEEFKRRINELIKKRGMTAKELIHTLSALRSIDTKSAENYLYGGRIPTSIQILLDIAQAIDYNNFLPTFLYITNLADMQKPSTLETYTEVVGNTLNVIVGKNVTISNVHISLQNDSNENISKFANSSSISKALNKFTMSFTCTKELHITSAYPVLSEDYRYRSYESITIKDNYVVIDGNIYHQSEGHVFGYKHSHKDIPISLYELVESVSEKKMSYEQFKDCIKQFQRTYQRQGAYYGTIGRTNISINTFCWLNFTVGFLMTLGKAL